MRSIRASLLVWILTGVSGAMLVAGLAVAIIAHARLSSLHDAALLSRARTFASLVTDEHDPIEFDYFGSLAEADLGVPVAWRFPYGHTARPSLTLPLGTRATLEQHRYCVAIDVASIVAGRGHARRAAHPTDALDPAR